MKRVRIAVLWVIIASLVMGGIWYFDAGGTGRFRRDSIVFPIMSTKAKIQLIGTEEQEIEKGFRAAREAMEKVVAVCNYFDPESELGRLNATASKAPFYCSAELWEILQEVRKYHRISEGAFDPTIRPLMKVWGFHRARKTLPSEEEIAEAKKRCGFRKILFNDNERSVFFEVSGMSIDLGGIAKGWAVDKAAEAVLKTTSIRRGFVDLGGNMRCFPLPPPGRKAYRIAVQDPKYPGRQIAVADVLDECIATSGDYERYVVINGKRYTHIIDPATGIPVSRTVSATVITPSGAASDALSTSLFIRGPVFAEKLDDRTRTLLIDADGNRHQRVRGRKKPFELLPSGQKDPDVEKK